MKSLPVLARRIGAALLCATSACAGLPRAGADLSTAHEPPRSWDAAVQFTFSDSSRASNVEHATVVEFHDGVRQRAVTARDLFTTPENQVRTPWYRLRPGKDGLPAVFRVTLEHAGGARTTADYPVTIRPDHFVTLSAGVFKHDHIPRSMSEPLYRSFPVHPAARTQPGDSLWIGYWLNGRHCFGCPR
jgi:hypothetical protein